MAKKRKRLWCQAFLAAGSALGLYISVSCKRRSKPLLLDATEEGAVFVTAHSLEQAIRRLLNEERNVHPLRIRAVLAGERVQKITGTVQLKQSRLTPTTEQLEEKIRLLVREQFGVELPAAALHFDTILT